MSDCKIFPEEFSADPKTATTTGNLFKAGSPCRPFPRAAHKAKQISFILLKMMRAYE
jgi:hypothetical protein